MATVSNSQNLPYTEIKPLTIPVKDYGNVRLGLTRVILIISSIAFVSSVGASVALGTGVSVLTGAVVGGVIGIVCGVVAAYFQRVFSSFAQYRIDTLSQLEEHEKAPRVLEAIKGLKKFFAHPFTRFYQTYHNHQIHNEITVITKSVDRSRPDIQKVWETFLNHLHGKKVINADGEQLTLDFSLELDRLKGNSVEIGEPELLNPSSERYDQDLEQLEEMQRESLGLVGLWPKNDLKQVLPQHPLHRCVVVRREGTDQILGFGWTLTSKTPEGEPSLAIAGFARRANAASMRIGDVLMYTILSMVKTSSPNQHLPMHLHVRKSNPAVSLYERWGFEKSSELPNYYKSGPPEDAYFMKLNWEKCEEVFQRLQKKAS